MPRHLKGRSVLHRFAYLTLVLCAASVAVAFGQSTPPNDPGSAARFTSKPAPLHHLYWNFLGLQRHLDQMAAELEHQGRSAEAAEMRSHLQTELRFTNAQGAILRQEARQMEQEANAVWAKAMPIMMQDREWLKLNGRSAGPPPGHAQVHALQEERETVIREAVARLNRRLGPRAAARLQARIEREWAPRVTVRDLNNQQVRNPGIDSKTSAPYHLEPQQ